MSVKSDIENLLRKSNNFDCETQMLILKLAGEIDNDPTTFGIDEVGEEELFELAVRMWRYLCVTDHNHCSITECRYADFVDDILNTPLQDIHFLWEGHENGDWDATEILKNIAFLRETLKA